MRLVRYLVLFVIVTVVTAFAVANRHAVPFVLDPLGGPQSLPAFAAPLFIFLFGAMVIGFLIGAFATWLGQSRWRSVARQKTREAAELRRENERLTRHLRVLERASQIRAFANQAEYEDRPLIH
jgi:uncharacterized integral membrane protein